jgi:transposase-like protein
MTDEKMALLEPTEKRAVADFIWEILAFTADRLMGFDVVAATGAALGAKSSDRLAQRNGYRERVWNARAGTIDTMLPRLRTGSHLPSFPEPRKTAEPVCPSQFEACAHVCTLEE